MNNNKLFELISNDEKTNGFLNILKSNNKLYLKMKDALNILGDFKRKTEVSIYDVVNTKEKSFVRLCFEDKLGNIFIIYADSTDRKDLGIINKETNDGSFDYDITLSKKFELNSKNIEFTRTSEVYNFKFGRFITDQNSFYSLYLGDNVGYQLQINYLTNDRFDVNRILSILSKMENVPSFKDFINIFEHIMKDTNIDYDLLSVSAYKNFEEVGNITLSNSKIKSTQTNKVLTKK